MDCAPHKSKEEIFDDDDDDNIGENVEGDDKTPRVGMVFTTYNEASSFYKQYALSVGFGVAVRKSSFTKSGICRRLILACTRGGKGRPDACYQARQTAKTNCQAMRRITSSRRSESRTQSSAQPIRCAINELLQKND
ncbi:Protein FAR1-RELATED SEQUENCE 6, partial [Ananas comosus]